MPQPMFREEKMANVEHRKAANHTNPTTLGSGAIIYHFVTPQWLSLVTSAGHIL